MSTSGTFGYTYGRVPTELLFSDVADRAKLLYAALTRYADQFNHAFPSRSLLAKHLHCSVDSIDRAIAQLKITGWLLVDRQHSEQGDYDVNRYTLLVPTSPDEPSQEVTAPVRSPSRNGAIRGDRKGAARTKSQLNEKRAHAREEPQPPPPAYPLQAGPVPTVTPDETRCRHRNDPQVCGLCADARRADIPDWRAALNPPPDEPAEAARLELVKPAETP